MGLQFLFPRSELWFMPMHTGGIMRWRWCLRVLTLAILLGVGTLPARAVAPTGWLWFSWPYAFSTSSGHWLYFSTADEMWCFGYSPANGWAQLGPSGIGSGWSFHTWPYAFDGELQAWFYMNEASTQWVLDLSNGSWSKLGPGVVAGEMVLVPAGSFEMGDTFGEGWVNEYPVHTNAMSAFFIDKYEVTKSLWDEVKAWGTDRNYAFSDLEGGKGADHPVHSVTWYDCLKWCNARSQREGLKPVYYVDAGFTVVYREGDLYQPFVNWAASGYRLPTEAEWEKAARGGVADTRFPWSDVNVIDHTRANYFSSESYTYDLSGDEGFSPPYASGGLPYTSPVGSFPANGYGLFDMAGNVWEWCWDWHSVIYYLELPGADPRGPATGPYRVIRGGSWYNEACYARVASRVSEFPNITYYDYGFRCVRR